MKLLARIVRSLWPLAMLLVSTHAAAAAPPKAPPKALAGANEYIERALADWKYVGAAVAVVQGDEPVYVRGFGLRENGKTAPVTADTLFEIGSTSKAFTTAALALLVDEGRIRWDDPIIRYVPGFELQDPWLTRHVTIRDAVTHRSGIPDSYYPWLSRMDADAVVKQLRYIPAEGEFRDSFRYNNLMYAASGKVIEGVTGKTWHEFVKQRVLAPLQMNRSGTSAYEYWDERYVAPVFFGPAAAGRPTFSQARDANVAMPHGLDATGATAVLPWRTFDYAAPAGSVVASAADMANWLRMHLHDGSFGGRQFLKKETLRELHSAQIRRLDVGRSQFPLEDLEIAMGWFRARYQGHLHVFHSGGIVGFPAYVAMLSDDDVGVVVLANGPVEVGDDYKFHRSVAFWIFDRLLGNPARDWSGEFRTLLAGVQRQSASAAEELARARVQDAPPTLPLEKYAGEYEDRKMPGHVSVSVANGRLELRFAGEGAFSGYLEHWHGNVFKLQPYTDGQNTLELGFTEFAIDAAGKVSSMSVASAFFRLSLDKVEPGTRK